MIMISDATQKNKARNSLIAILPPKFIINFGILVLYDLEMISFITRVVELHVGIVLVVYVYGHVPKNSCN